MAIHLCQPFFSKIHRLPKPIISQVDTYGVHALQTRLNGRGLGQPLGKKWLVQKQQTETSRTVGISCMAKKEKKLKGKKGPSLLVTEKPPSPPVEPYNDGDIIMHSLTLIDSYFRCLGKPIFPEKVEISSAAKALWELPLAVVSHGTEEDPIFNYANKAALEVFGVDWETFTSWPSRETASKEDQPGRDKLLASSLKDATICSAIVRRNPAGREFRILDVQLWPLTDLNGEYYGQAAIYGGVEFLDEDKKDDVVVSESTEPGISTPSQEHGDSPPSPSISAPEPALGPALVSAEDSISS